VSWKCEANKFLKVDWEHGVEINSLLDDGICALDSWFESWPSIVTSGDRTFDKQLDVIRDVALRFAGLGNVHPNLKTVDMQLPYNYKGQLVPFWLVVWSECLQKRVMVNPPVQSACLFAYQHVDGRQLPAGHIIGVSSHQLHKSFDIGGGKAIGKVEAVVKAAFDSKTIPEFHGYLFEDKQNAIHTDWRLANAEPAIH
jgi:hypothetical protein